MTRFFGLLLLLGATPALAQTELSTTGQGRVVFQPDHVRLRLGVDIRAGSAAAASSLVGTRVEQARQAIRAKGFILDSIRVTSFDVSPNYDMNQERRRLVDYGGRATIELTVRPLNKLGSVLDTAFASGVNDVAGMSFASDSAPAGRDRAIALAVQRSKRDAEAMARAVGGRVGRLMGISTNDYYPPYEERGDMALFKASAMAGGAPNVEREVVVSVQVQARWEFVPSQ